jgi:hypothetical protein|tara:strand:+ start:336 stop:623 length:288 start_codon:yes stop_codon:yes gene_type:complete
LLNWKEKVTGANIRLNNKIPTVEQLVEIAREVEIEDPINWEELNVSEESAYNLIANQVLSDHMMRNSDDHEVVLLATVTKLIVENFILNIKLLQK